MKKKWIVDPQKAWIIAVVVGILVMLASILTLKDKKKGGPNNEEESILPMTPDGKEICDGDLHEMYGNGDPEPNETQSGVLTYTDQYGNHYSFGMKSQPEGVSGICLDPKCEPVGDTVIGLSLFPVGCVIEESAAAFDSATGKLAVIERVTSKSGRGETTIQLLDPSYRSVQDYGIVWTQDLLSPNTSTESSQILVSATDMSYNTLIEVFSLNFERMSDGSYAMTSITKVEEEPLEVKKDILGPALNDILGWEQYRPDLFPLELSMDFTDKRYSSMFPVYKLKGTLSDTLYYPSIRAAGSSYSLVDECTDRDAELYAAVLNINKDYGWSALYFLIDPGTKELNYVGYDALGKWPKTE